MNKILYTLIPEKYSREKMIFPRDIDDKTVYIDVHEYNISTINDIRFMTNRDVKVNMVSLDSIFSNINKAYDKNKDNMPNKNIYEKIVTELLNESIKKNASDIHIEPFTNYFRVRYRIEGELITVSKHPIDDYYQISTIIKLKSGCDITEKRLPQDGRFSYVYGDSVVDIRFSSIPTVNGEKIELRILNRDRFLMKRNKLGFSNEAIEIMDIAINSGRGMLIVSGATGSGKSSTLYSIIDEIKDNDINITTIEDPVEYKIEGINQIQVNSKIGLGFDSGLRSVLRQDPDFIVVGEIRDLETAEMAVRAAVTGHFVMTTLHTNDVFSTLDRLRDIGVEDYMINSAISCIISQKLVKKSKLIDNYKEDDRGLIYEILYLDDEIKQELRNGRIIKSSKDLPINSKYISYEDSLDYLRKLWS